MGVVPKRNPGEFRMIHNLSYPEGASINSGIPSEFSQVSYASIQDAITYIKQAKSTIYLGKMDVESAFRIIPICPQDRPLLGFHWEGKFYMDAVLPMGCSSSCQIFETFSTALEWIAKTKLGAAGVVHMIDDFLFMAPSKEKCALDMRKFAEMCEGSGIPLAPDKTVGPDTTLPFLGITLDTVSMEARLPEDKLTDCRSILSEFLSREKVTLKELQRLIGILNFACSVIIPGRCFLRRLIDLTTGVRKPYHRVRLNKPVKLDLELWLTFLAEYNGISFFLDQEFLSGDYLRLYTDSAGKIGYGALFGKQWFCGRWPESWLGYNISTLELYPIVAAVATWGHEWANKSICFYTDNIALVSIINKQTSRDPNIMSLVRKLVLICLGLNILFTAHHVLGRNNTLADKLSRFQMKEFHALAPWADHHPTQVPRWISPEILEKL